jgi:hypothetical protein
MKFYENLLGGFRVATCLETEVEANRCALIIFLFEGAKTKHFL